MTSMYKKCFVPTCGNDNKNYPKKLFLCVPQDKRRRERWFRSVNYDGSARQSHRLYACEDHFNLEEDTENWMFFKTMGCNIRLKKNVVPHIFKQVSSESQFPEQAKKRKAEILEDLHQKKLARDLFESQFPKPVQSTPKQLTEECTFLMMTMEETSAEVPSPFETLFITRDEMYSLYHADKAIQTDLKPQTKSVGVMGKLNRMLQCSVIL